MASDIYIAEFTIDACSDGSVGKTFRQFIPSSKLLTDSDSVLVHFGYVVGCACHIIEMCIGHSGVEDYDFDGNQVHLKVGGSESFTIDQPNIVTDKAIIDIDKSKDLILSWYMTADGHQGCPISTNSDVVYDTYFRSVNLSCDTLFPAPGYVADTNHIHLVKKITSYVEATLSGTVKLKGSPVERIVRAYVRSTGVLYDSTVSLANGTFSLNAPNDTTEMFVIAYDDPAGDQYNALIYDRVKGILV